MEPFEFMDGCLSLVAPFLYDSGVLVDNLDQIVSQKGSNGCVI